MIKLRKKEMKTFEIKVKNEKECDKGCYGLEWLGKIYKNGDNYGLNCVDKLHNGVDAYACEAYSCKIFGLFEKDNDILNIINGKIFRCENCKEIFKNEGIKELPVSSDVAYGTRRISVGELSDKEKETEYEYFDTETPQSNGRIIKKDLGH